MSIESNKLMNLADGKVLYDDLRARVDQKSGAKPIVFALDNVSNTSGSYSHTTTVSAATATMKPIAIEVSNPAAFLGNITVTCANGSITLSCPSVEGTSTVSVTVEELAQNAGESMITSEEFAVLDGRIGPLSSLQTTEKGSLVGAVNENTTAISSLSSDLSSKYEKPSGGIPSTDLADSYIEEPSSDGTSGQVLTTDGNGGRSWTTVQGGGGSVTVDTALSTSSTNPVQNKVITNTLNDKEGALDSLKAGVFNAVTPTIQNWGIYANNKVIYESTEYKTAVFKVEIGKKYCIVSDSTYLRTARIATAPSAGDTSRYYEVHDSEGIINNYTPDNEYVLVVFYHANTTGADNVYDIFMAEQDSMPSQITSNYRAEDADVLKNIYETNYSLYNAIPPYQILKKTAIDTSNKKLKASTDYNVAIYAPSGTGWHRFIYQGSRCRSADSAGVQVVGGDALNNYTNSETNGGFINVYRAYVYVEYSNLYAPPIFYAVDRGRYLQAYFNDQITAVETQVKNCIATVGKDGQSFVFFTDSHAGNNYRTTPPIIKKIMEDVPVSTLICGGDVMDSGSKSSEITKAESYLDLFDFAERFLFVLGNHDENKNGHESASSYWLSKPEDYELYFARSENLMNDFGYCYYYYDIPATNTRFIIVDIAYGSIDSTQKTWITDLLTASSDKNVILIGHYIREEDGTYPSDGSWLCGLTATYSCIKAIIHGHCHYDQEDRTANGVCIIGVDRDGNNRLSQYNKYTASAGTVTETAFDVITVDYQTGDVYCNRIGRGKNRIERAGVTSVSSTATLTSSLTGTLTWESSDTSVATVSGGVVTKVASGSAIITASDTGRNTEVWKVSVS